MRRLLVHAFIVTLLAAPACLAGSTPASTDSVMGATAKGPSAESELDGVLARMDARAKEIQTLEADITITNVENFSGRQSVRSGKVYVRKPDDLALDITKPYPRKIWITAKEILDYRPDLKTGDRVALAKDAERPQVIGLSTTAADLKESFDITLAPTNEKPKEYTLTLVPKAGVKADFTSAEVTISAATMLPLVIVQKNKDLDETKTYAFENTKVNPRLPDSVFEPKLPKDADIQDHEGDWKGP
jgi:outer membrane lipoprotein-sorting protein